MKSPYLLLLLLALTGCRTRYVALTDVVRDSIYITRIDTLTRVITRNKTDTVRLRDSVTVYRDAVGNIERTDRWVIKEHFSSVHDTVDTYRARYDSLAAVMERQKDVPVPVVKARPWWRKLWPAAVAVCLLAMCIVVMRYARRSRDNI